MTAGATKAAKVRRRARRHDRRVGRAVGSAITSPVAAAIRSEAAARAIRSIIGSAPLSHPDDLLACAPPSERAWLFEDRESERSPEAVAPILGPRPRYITSDAVMYGSYGPLLIG